MNPEIKAKWVAALRSGEYKQGRGALRQHGLFCCLGVLCDLHAKATGGKWITTATLGLSSYCDSDMTASAPVLDWAGLPPDDFLVRYGVSECLTEANDKGRSFEEIADIIERAL